MDYTVLESEIVGRLAPLVTAGHDVIALPETQAQSDKAFPNTRVIVGYSHSDYANPKSTAQIIQDENVYIHVSVWSRKLRGNGYLYAVSDAVRKLLVGYMPSNCNRIHLDKQGLEEFDPGAGLWARNIIFKCTTRVAEDFEDESGTLITQITIDENPDNPGAVVVPPPDTWPPNPPSARIGDTSYWNGEVWVRLAPGEDGQVLTTHGIGEAPTWEDAAAAEETDPIFSASAAAEIAVNDVMNWNTAYGWGDHATAGYLTSESDPIFSASDAAGITSGDIANWNTAYGWGDHAGLYSLLGHTHDIADININDNVDFGGNRATGVADPIDDYDAVNKKTLDAAISETNVYDLQGSLDCSTNPNFPPAVKGMRWEVNIPGKIGGAGGIDVEEWDEVVCIVDNAGGDFATVGSSWYVVKSRVLQAEEDHSGTAELATNAETQAGADDMRIVTPLKLANWWEYVKGLAQTFAAKITFTIAPRFSSVTANHVLTVDGNKDLSSEAKGTAFNKDFGTGTTNIPAIGSTLGNSLPVQTDGTGKIITSTVATFKTLLGLNNVENTALSTWAGSTALTTLGTIVTGLWNGSVIRALYGGADDWVDYSNTSTIVGWGSYTIKIIRYQRLYKRTRIHFAIAGPSNSTTTTFSLPIAAGASAAGNIVTIFLINGGVTSGTPGRAFISGSTCTLAIDMAGNTFSGTGTKQVVGQLEYEND